MILLYIVILLLLIVVMWDAVKGFHLVFTAQASAMDMIARVGFRKPILSFEFTKNAMSPMLIVRCFNIVLLRKDMAAKQKPGGMKKGIRLARSATIANLAVSADVGLGDPFNTSMALAAAGTAARFLPIQQLDLVPDYLSAEPYLSVRGNVTVKFGKTILKYVRS